MNRTARPYEEGKPALVAPALFLATDETLVELDGCLCDFVVRRRDGRVMLRQRRGEFAHGRRLPVAEVEHSDRVQPLLDIDVPVTAAALAAPTPEPGSWQEKLKLGFLTGVTQVMGTMFSFGLQHETAESILEQIVEHWKDVSGSDLIEECADTAVSTAHLALRHYLGTFHQATVRLFDPWLNHALAAGSFEPQDPEVRALAADLVRPVDAVLLQREVCAYAIQEQLCALADEDRLLHLAARVPQLTAPFLNGLIHVSAISAVSEGRVMEQKSLNGRIEALRTGLLAKLDGPVELGMLPDMETLAGAMLADVGGLLFAALADPKLLAAVANGSKEPAISPELLLAAWYRRVADALAN